MTWLSQDCDSHSHYRDESFKRRVAEAWVTTDESTYSVGHRFGVHPTTVIAWAGRYFPEELAARRARVGKNVRTKRNPELLQQAVALAERGVSLNQASRLLRVSTQFLSEFLRDSGYGALIQNPRRRYIPVEVKRQAAGEYLAGTPSYKVAPKYDVSPTSVERWANESLAGEL